MKVLDHCPLCGSDQLQPATGQDRRAVQPVKLRACKACRLVLREPAPEPHEVYLALAATPEPVWPALAPRRRLLHRLWPHRGARLLLVSPWALSLRSALGLDAADCEAFHPALAGAGAALHPDHFDGPWEQAPWTGPGFDGIVWFGGLQWEMDAVGRLALLRQWIRPGGRLLLTVPSFALGTFRLDIMKQPGFPAPALLFKPHTLRLALFSAGWEPEVILHQSDWAGPGESGRRHGINLLAAAVRDTLGIGSTLLAVAQPIPDPEEPAP